MDFPLYLAIHNFCLMLLGCTEGDIRLANGTNSMEGRVEICLSNEWGTVCDQSWDSTDAGVVCRQLEQASSGNYIKSCHNGHTIMLTL